MEEEADNGELLPEVIPPLTCTERGREVLFTILDHPIFLVVGIFLLFVVVVAGLFYFFLLMGWHGLCSPVKDCEPRNWWASASIHLLCGIFTYISIVSMPWRVSNFLHSSRLSCPFRSNDTGRDLKGLPSDDIWFHIPAKKRTHITLVLLFNCIFQFVQQAMRFVYSSWKASNAMPGSLAINLPFIASIVLGALGAVMTGMAENKLRKEFPGKFTPGIMEILKAKLKGDEPEEVDTEATPTPTVRQSVRTSKLSASVVMRNELRLYAL